MHIFEVISSTEKLLAKITKKRRFLLNFKPNQRGVSISKGHGREKKRER